MFNTECPWKLWDNNFKKYYCEVYKILKWSNDDYDKFEILTYEGEIK